MPGRVIVDYGSPDADPRDYAKKADKIALVVAEHRVFFDEGYRWAETGEEVPVSAEDLALLVNAGQVTDVTPAAK